MAKPAPSLPLLGSDWPPVARTTAAARQLAAVGHDRGSRPDACRSIGLDAGRRRARGSPRPGRADGLALAQQRRRARRARGSCRETACRRLPRAGRRRSRGRTRWCRRPERRAARAGSTDGRPPQKSRSVTVVFVTLQRDPPLTRIFAPGARAPSRRTTERERLNRRVKIAVARPAAPAPTIATSHESGSSEARRESLA